jgi:UV DNA damage endonuclease
MIRRIGFACVMYGARLSTNHTIRLANLPSDRFREAVRRNLQDLQTILAWMEVRGLRLFRIGSSMVPFASHRAMRWDWPDMVGPELARIGRTYASKGFRFSMHPGQYNVLNSPRLEVVERTLAELDYSCRVLDLMGLDSSHKVVLHGGGLYGDPAESRSRLVRVLRTLPAPIRSRLVLENDERYFSFAEIVEIGEESGLPPVFDLHHHLLNPSADIHSLLLQGERLWDSRPKVHLSSPAPGLRSGAHDLFVRRQDLDLMLEILPFEVDLMVEAKAKEEAALEVLGMLGRRREGALSQSDREETG